MFPTTSQEHPCPLAPAVPELGSMPTGAVSQTQHLLPWSIHPLGYISPRDVMALYKVPCAVGL